MATSTLFFHKDCGGNLVVDVLEVLELTTPSLSITLQGMKLGVMELDMKELPKNGLVFKCQDCEEKLNSSTDTKSIEIECQICQVKHNVSDMYVTSQIPFICKGCADLAKKRPEKPTRIQERAIKILSLLPLSGLNRPVNLVDILKQKVQFM